MMTKIIEDSADIIGYRFEIDPCDCSDVSMLFNNYLIYNISSTQYKIA